MRPYPRFGGESVSFAKTSLALYILYSLFLLLSTLWLLYGSSGLLCKLAHPVHLKMHRCVIPLSPPQKKSRSGSFSVAERVGFEPTVRLRRTHDFQSCSLGQLGHLSTKFFIKFSLHHLLAKCSSCCAVVCIIARCLSIIR